MSTPEDDFEEDIGSAVLPVEVEEAAVPIALNALQPWHRPRKQYVRERQWQSCANHLIQRLQNSQAPSLRDGKLNYMTLPGIDHFDVEVIGQTAIAAGLKLEATGFLSEAESDPIKARSQVRADALIKRGLIEDTSITFPYSFEDMASRKSQAYREIKSRAPFHIINVDACGSIALPRAQHSSRIIDALHSLIELQLGTMTDPWVLFLTTDARPESLSLEVQNALDDAIRQNAAASEDFREGAVNCVGVDGQELEAALAHAQEDPARFVSKFSLGLSKWLLHNADAQGWDLKSKVFFCYSTRPGEDDRVSMPCLAYEFRRRPLVMPDLFGAVQNPAPQQENPTDYSTIALQRASAMQNLDQLFADSMDIQVDFAQKQRLLLQDAGYSDAALADFDAQFLA
jgi:2-hydroxychromene-2-carboxylate isomerase